MRFLISYRNENEAVVVPCVKISVYRNESENWSHVFFRLCDKKGRLQAGHDCCKSAKLLSTSKCGNEVRYEGQIRGIANSTQQVSRNFKDLDGAHTFWVKSIPA